MIVRFPPRITVRPLLLLTNPGGRGLYGDPVGQFSSAPTLPALSVFAICLVLFDAGFLRICRPKVLIFFFGVCPFFSVLCLAAATCPIFCCFFTRCTNFRHSHPRYPLHKKGPVCAPQVRPRPRDRVEGDSPLPKSRFGAGGLSGVDRLLGPLQGVGADQSKGQMTN